MNTSEVLNKAADLIESRGWTKGAAGWYPEAGRELCLEGGIAAALNLNRFDIEKPAFRECPAYRSVQSYLNATEALWRFNDTHDENTVVEVLRAAAVIEAARESKPAEVSR